MPVCLYIRLLSLENSGETLPPYTSLHPATMEAAYKLMKWQNKFSPSNKTSWICPVRTSGAVYGCVTQYGVSSGSCSCSRFELSRKVDPFPNARLCGLLLSKRRCSCTPRTAPRWTASPFRRSRRGRWAGHKFSSCPKWRFYHSVHVNINASKRGSWRNVVLSGAAWCVAAETACCWRHSPYFCWHMVVAHMLQKSASDMCDRVCMTVCVRLGSATLNFQNFNYLCYLWSKCSSCRKMYLEIIAGI